MPQPVQQTNSLPTTDRRTRPRSRSSSSRCSNSRQRDEALASIPLGVNHQYTPKRVKGIGRGKAKESKTPIVAPASLLAGTTMARPNLRITVPADSSGCIVEVLPYPANVVHLANLEGEASSRWELTKATAVKPDLVVNLPLEDRQEDSDVDLRTGESRNPNTWCEPIRFPY